MNLQACKIMFFSKVCQIRFARQLSGFAAMAKKLQGKVALVTASTDGYVARLDTSLRFSFLMFSSLVMISFSL